MCIHARTHARARAHTHTHTHIYIYMYTCIYHNINFVQGMTEIRDVCLYLIEKWAVQIWSIELTLILYEMRKECKLNMCNVVWSILHQRGQDIYLYQLAAREDISLPCDHRSFWYHINFSRKCERATFPCHFQK